MSSSIVNSVTWIHKHKTRTPAERNSYRRIKRWVDVFLVCAAMPLWVPVAICIAIAIKLEDPKGSVIFRQMRTASDCKRVAIYKFRSMVHNAEELKASLAHLNERTPPDFKITNDPRITRVGKIIRPTSLDEIPQLINVLEGKLSLVGPRPTSVAPDKMQQWHLERFHVPAGLTGLWQVSGRSLPNYDDRVRMDIAYIERQCLSIDLSLMLRTVSSVVKREGV